MDYRSLHSKTVAELRQIAKVKGVKVPTGTKKDVLVEMILDRITAEAMRAEAEKSAQKAPQAANAIEEKTPLKEKEAITDKTASKGKAPSRGKAVSKENIVPKEGKPERVGNGSAEKKCTEALKEQMPKQETKVPTAPQPKDEPAKAVDSESKSPETPSTSEGKPSVQRPLSTQQRMGARTQPIPGNYRPQQRVQAKQQPQQRPQNRFNTETQPPRTSAVRRTQLTAENPQPQANAPFRHTPVNAEAAQQQEPLRVRRATAVSENAQANVEERRPLTVAPEAPAQPEDKREDRREESAQVVSDMIASGECGTGAGILEIHPDGYGFLRAENYLPGNRDVYVSAAQIRRFNLRTGDYVVGKTRAQQYGDRSVGLIFIDEVNGLLPESARSRRFFDTLVPVYPNERLRMEREGENDISLRLIDVVAPIGKGQRGMIVSQPKAGKTTLLKKIANAITANNPEVHLIVLLIDERPEEVTDMRRSITGEVVYSTFDEAPENHTRVSEMVLERAQRLVELGKDVVVLLDSITRLARAYNLVIPPTGRSLSGGLDPGALFRPKRFFGAARNIENGGSLTIIATALVDTGSRMDDIIFEEFKGTGNMELHLDRSLSDRRVFPAIDLYKSGTRREELLMTPEELEGEYCARRLLSKGGSPQEAAEQLISLIEKTKNNTEFFGRVKGWLNACEKGGFNAR